MPIGAKEGTLAMDPIETTSAVKVLDAAGRYRAGHLVVAEDGVVHLLIPGPFHGRIGDMVQFVLAELDEPIIPRSAIDQSHALRPAHAGNRVSDRVAIGRQPVSSRRSRVVPVAPQKPLKIQAF
jgi:hypothetical protein